MTDDKPTHIWMTNEDRDALAAELGVRLVTRAAGLEIVSPGHPLWPMFASQVKPGNVLVVALGANRNAEHPVKTVSV